MFMSNFVAVKSCTHLLYAVVIIKLQFYNADYLFIYLFIFFYLFYFFFYFLFIYFGRNWQDMLYNYGTFI